MKSDTTCIAGAPPAQCPLDAGVSDINNPLIGI